jgi:hypothetical protein
VEVADIMIEVIDALDAHGIPYMLVGSFSSNFYGIPRSTKDVDLVLEFGQRSVHDLTRSLGPRYSLQPQVGFESVTGTTRYIIDLASTHFQVELFSISNDPHDRERFARRRKVAWLNRQIWLPRPEDVIVTKLRWLADLRRNKDYDDILQVATVQSDRLDWDYVTRWADQHGTRKLLDDIRAAVPKI